MEADTTVIEHLDFEPSCEGINHPAGTFGHNPDESATHLMVLPCGPAGLRCAGFVRRNSAPERGIICGICEVRHPQSAIRWVPL